MAADHRLYPINIASMSMEVLDIGANRAIHPISGQSRKEE
jgi:hypothetical protein